MYINCTLFNIKVYDEVDNYLYNNDMTLTNHSIYN